MMPAAATTDPLPEAFGKLVTPEVTFLAGGSGDGELQFEARTVVLGRPSRGMVPVVSGLKSGEKIVVRGGLLLDGAASQLL